MNTNGEEPALTMRDVVKRFGGIRALDGANLKVRRGTIHGLVGQNGAGKSTLIKILAGIYQPDSGSIEVAGQRYRHLTPHKVEKLGIRFIHQERLLAPSFTVGEALFLGSEPCVAPLPLLNRRRMKREAAGTVRSYFGVDLPNGALISELTPAQQQIVQIARALLRNPSLLVFDEPTAAAVQRLRHRNAFKEVSLVVRSGEIVGITGLLGSGVKELIRCLFGLLRAEGGEINIEGKPVRLQSPFAAVQHKLGLVPEDRPGHGVALDMSVRENVTLASLRQYSRLGFLELGREKDDVDKLISKLSVRTPNLETAVRSLSGGNQQKVSLGKWLSRHASLYILDEPTVGVDVGAKVEIYRLIGELAEKRAGILILSTDLLELLGICDRILVMFRGRVVREFFPAETNGDELLRCATGADGTSVAVNA